MCSRPSPPLELLADFGVCVTDSALFASSQIPLAAGAVILLGDRDRLLSLTLSEASAMVPVPPTGKHISHLVVSTLASGCLAS